VGDRLGNDKGLGDDVGEREVMKTGIVSCRVQGTTVIRDGGFVKLRDYELVALGGGLVDGIAKE
jgi:hypothetical protein